MWYKSVLSSLICLIYITSYAQTAVESKPETILLYVPVKETYLITGVTFNQFAQLESMVSPLVYTGNGAGASLGLQKRKKKTYTSFIAHYSQAKLYNEIQPKQNFAGLSHVNIQVSACYEFSKFEQKNTKALLGWQLGHLSDFRRNVQLQNSNLTYNLSSTLSPVFRLEKWLSIKENKQRKFFKKERSMRLIYQLAVPFIASISRPPYNAIRVLHDGLGSAYQNSITQEVISGQKLYTLNNFFSINSSLAFEYFIKNGTRISLQYFWNFENFTEKNSSYKVSQTGFQLSLHTRLNAL